MALISTTRFWPWRRSQVFGVVLSLKNLASFSASEHYFLPGMLLLSQLHSRCPILPPSTSLDDPLTSTSGCSGPVGRVLDS